MYPYNYPAQIAFPMKAKVYMSVKKPIPGIDYSNLEVGMSFEKDAYNIEEVQKELKVQVGGLIKEWEELLRKEVSGVIDSLVEEKMKKQVDGYEKKLAEARKEYIKLQKELDEVKGEDK